MRNLCLPQVIVLSVLLMNTSNATADKPLEQAIFAGGCFWCTENVFKDAKGVTEVVSGYTGGSADHPTYDDYASKGYVEAVQITYDPSVISYSDLLDLFWRQVDPTDTGGQFVDRGRQYCTAIFYLSPEQKRLAEQSKEKISHAHVFKDPVVTEITKATTFYKAEDYHQNFCKLHPARYETYKKASGREAFLKKIWGDVVDKSQAPSPAQDKMYRKLSEEEIKNKLTPVQCDVTQGNGTEKPFHNPYWDNHKEGIYVDIVSGEPLFSSVEKFDSRTGWPSFNKPLEPGNIVEKENRDLGLRRIEVRSKHADSHLGHLFSDGPAPTGLRYCINSAALRFIPKEDLDKEGYDEYKKLFSE